MTRRVLTAAFAACLALPAAAAAQIGPGAFHQLTEPRFRVTPFGGYLTGFTRTEEWVYTDGTNTVVLDTEMHIAGGGGGGIHVEAPAWGNFGVSALAGFFSRGETAFVVLSPEDARRIDGTNTLLGRVNVAFRVPPDESEFVLRRLDAAVYAGGVVLHERYRNTLGTAELLDDATHFGINLGMSAELPFAGGRYAVQIGIEDNIMFWRTAPLAELAAVYPNRPMPDYVATVTTSESHTWLVRAGLSFRLH